MPDLGVQLLKEAANKRERTKLSIKAVVVVAAGIVLMAALVRLFA